VHVACEGWRQQRGGHKPPNGARIGRLALSVPYTRGTSDSRPMRFSVCDERRGCIVGGYGFSRMLDMDEEGTVANRHAVVPPWLDAEVVGNVNGRVHCPRDAIDIVEGQPSIGKCPR
jgi:hypothetical protein